MINETYIRESVFSDLISIHKISKSSLKNSWSLKSFEEDFNNMFSKYFSLIYKNEVIGFLSSWIVIDEVTITNIGILEEFRGNHLSKTLLNNLFSLYKNFNFFLEVRESNLIAISLYKSLGFLEIFKRDSYYKNPTENAIIMKKF